MVDDDNISHIVIKRIFSESFQIRSAYTGEEALKFLREGLQPALVLMDDRMPGADGCEIFRNMKALDGFRGTPVLFVSSEADPETEKRCLEEGAADYLGKPFSPRLLYSRVQAVTDPDRLCSNLRETAGQS